MQGEKISEAYTQQMRALQSGLHAHTIPAQHVARASAGAAAAAQGDSAPSAAQHSNGAGNGRRQTSVAQSADLLRFATQAMAQRPGTDASDGGGTGDSGGSNGSNAAPAGSKEAARGALDAAVPTLTHLQVRFCCVCWHIRSWPDCAATLPKLARSVAPGGAQL